MRPVKAHSADSRFDQPGLAVYREEVFSPGKVMEDAAVLDTALAALVSMGCCRPRTLRAEELDPFCALPGWVLSMAQSASALAVLHEWERQGVPVINSVAAVRNCYRRNLMRLLSAGGIAIPASRMAPPDRETASAFLAEFGPCWLKRGDFHALRAQDVVRVHSSDQLGRALEYFRSEDVKEILIQAHVAGEVVKFYGTGPGEYFEAFIESSGKRLFPVDRRLMAAANRAAELTGLEFFGGDAVITNRGEVLLIDLNDWPSFSRCRAAAARWIAGHTRRRCAGGLSDAAQSG